MCKVVVTASAILLLKTALVSPGQPRTDGDRGGGVVVVVTASAILLLKTALVSPGQPRTDGDRGGGGGGGHR